jgi:hypothetical protein
MLGIARENTMRWVSLGMLLFFWQATAAHAGEVEIVHTTFAKSKDPWQVQTTLRHDDTGWEHYADAWRVVTENGKVLGTRVFVSSTRKRTTLHP